MSPTTVWPELISTGKSSPAHSMIRSSFGHEQKALVAGQREAARGGILAHQGLNEGRQVGHVLDFIENNRAVQWAKNPPRGSSRANSR